jgi:hypothetical protein
MLQRTPIYATPPYQQVSAATASAYFHSLVPEVNVEWMTVCILGLFAVLSLIGESRASLRLSFLYSIQSL